MFQISNINCITENKGLSWIVHQSMHNIVSKRKCTKLNIDRWKTQKWGSSYIFHSIQVMEFINTGKSEMNENRWLWNFFYSILKMECLKTAAAVFIGKYVAIVLVKKKCGKILFLMRNEIHIWESKIGQHFECTSNK